MSYRLAITLDRNGHPAARGHLHATMLTTADPDGPALCGKLSRTVDYEITGPESVTCKVCKSMLQLF